MGPSKKENLVNIVIQKSIELQSFLNKFKLPDYDQRHRDYKKLFDLEKSIIAINFYNDLSVEKFKYLTNLNDLNFLNNVHENI